MTDLPIDYNKRPWKAKYLDEETPVMRFWFIFGEHPDGKTVDISDGDQDVFVNIPREAAEEICKARWDCLDIILKHFSNFDIPTRTFKPNKP